MNTGPNEYSEITPARVRALRRKTGMTQPDFARSLGTSQSVISKIERGINLPNGPLALRLAQMLQSEAVPHISQPEGISEVERSRLLQVEPISTPDGPLTIRIPPTSPLYSDSLKLLLAFGNADPESRQAAMARLSNPGLFKGTTPRQETALPALLRDLSEALQAAADLDNQEAQGRLVTLAVEHALAARAKSAQQPSTVSISARYALISQILSLIEKFGADPALTAVSAPAGTPRR